MDSLTPTPFVAAAIRTLVAFLGGWAASKGLISADQLTALSPDLVHALGVVAAAAVLAWSWWQKTHQVKQVAAAKADGAAAVASAQLGAVANTGVKS